MDVKSAFLYGTIDEEVYVMQPPKFQDPAFLAKVYKVEKAMYGLHQAPRALKEDVIFLSHDKYIGDILKKFRYLDVRSSNTPIDKENPWRKDRTRKDVDLYLYRSMIGSLMYLTVSRPDIINKARLVAQRHTKEEGIDYDKVFAPVARIEAIRLSLAYASFMGYQTFLSLCFIHRIHSVPDGYEGCLPLWHYR
nr:hypothetical protein [Tanacetum cinerariifolium]